jgi:hypothetical protein
VLMDAQHPQRSADAWASHYSRRKKGSASAVCTYTRILNPDSDPGPRQQISTPLAQARRARTRSGTRQARRRSGTHGQPDTRHARHCAADVGTATPVTASTSGGDEGPPLTPTSAFAAHPKSRLKHFVGRKPAHAPDAEYTAGPSTSSALLGHAAAGVTPEGVPAASSAAAAKDLGGGEESMSESSMSEDEGKDRDGTYVDLDADAEGEDDDEAPAQTPQALALAA